MPDEENIISDELKLKLQEDEIIKSVKSSGEYLYYWNMQKMTLALFLLLLTASIIWSWWILLISFTFLGVNLYANFKRMRLLLEHRTASH
ncbi:MAG: hypothetical protein WBB86_02125 [Candidatus Omnitrophota bacterium]